MEKKKTIFIVTYDENDGYFDHIPPFSIPDNSKPGTGKCSAGIETEIEHVRLENELAQGVPPRLPAKGPLVLASGCRCSLPLPGAVAARYAHRYSIILPACNSLKHSSIRSSIKTSGWKTSASGAEPSPAI